MTNQSQGHNTLDQL